MVASSIPVEWIKHKTRMYAVSALWLTSSLVMDEAWERTRQYKCAVLTVGSVNAVGTNWPSKDEPRVRRCLKGGKVDGRNKCVINNIEQENG